MYTNKRMLLFFLYGSLIGIMGIVGFAQESQPTTGVSAKIVLTLSIDWEGRSLEPQNLLAIQQFREQFPQIPLTHFICVAYWSRSTQPSALTERMKPAFKTQDEIGLHIHCWRSLVQASGVPFRTSPTYWGPRYSLFEYEGDLGHEVEVSAYTREEIQKITKHSVQLLHEQGFQLGKSFRCGGWLATPDVLHALRAEGFLYDSSATDFRWHENELQGLPILRRLQEIWPSLSKNTQPFWIETPAGKILELPDTGALADYVTAEEMTQHLQEALALATPEKPRFVHCGFHQESAYQYLPRLIAFVKPYEKDSQIRWETLQEAALLFQKFSSSSEENPQPK